METISFFSYKGGVGRTLALSNLAERFSELNQDVFLIDFDLEAPGLHYKFKAEIIKAQKTQGHKKGLVDYLHTFLFENARQAIPQSLTDYYYTLPFEGQNKNGNIYIMTAGNFNSGEYWEKLSKIDWKKDFLNEHDRIGTKLLFDLKERIYKELKPNYLLIDSRTGISDITTLTLRLLADKILVIGTNSPESVDGSEIVLKSLKLSDNNWNNREKQLFFSLSRFPKPISNGEIEREKNIIKKIKDRFVPQYVSSDSFAVLHDDRELIWEEKRIASSNETMHIQLKEDYFKLVSLMVNVSSNSPLAENVKEVEKAEEKYEQSIRLLETRDYEKALELINSAIHIKPLAKYYAHRGHIYHFIKNYSLAVEDYSRFLEENIEDNFLYLSRAVCYSKLFKKESAQQDFLRALELNPYEGYNFLLYAEHLSDNDDDSALEYYQKAIELEPNDSSILSSYASYLDDIKLYNEADAIYQKAISINQSAPILGNYALFLTDSLVNYEKAEIYYKKALVMDPDEVNNHANYAVFLANYLNRYVDAEYHYKKSLEMEPNSSDYLANYAQYLLCLGRVEDAKQYLQKAQENLDDFSDKEQLGIELLFYQYAHYWSSDDELVFKIRKLLGEGVRASKWRFHGNILQAEKQNHPNIKLLKNLAKEITE